MDNNKLFLSHIDDLVSSVKRGRKYAFTSFLNLEQVSEALLYIKRYSNIGFLFYGGYEDAERKILGFSVDTDIDFFVFPITTLCFDFSNKASISHRDVLGSLMSLGIKRELIGDIIFTDKVCYIFVDSKIASFVCMNLNSVRSVNVNVSVYDGDIEYSPSFEECSCIVSSMRLDCVVSEIVNKSRTYSALSVRHIGKFRVYSDEGVTKKNRIKLKILKYI